MARLLTAEYDAYLTMDPSYEKVVLEGFADMVDQGLVTRRRKPVHWSIANETALAEAELEYQDREDLSVYVDFVACDADAVAAAFNANWNKAVVHHLDHDPVDLAANLAIAVHEQLPVRLVPDGRQPCDFGLGSGGQSRRKAGVSCEILAECDGSALAGCRMSTPSAIAKGGGDRGLRHPGRRHRSGAHRPGHGAEDYQRVCVRVSTPIAQCLVMAPTTTPFPSGWSGCRFGMPTRR